MRAVARYCTAPRAIHWKTVLGILEYINGTSEYGITFQRGTLSGISLEVFADADYAPKGTDRRSVSGGVIMCGGAIVYFGFPGLRNALPFRLQKRSMLLSEMR